MNRESTVSGTVLREGRPLAGAYVSLKGSSGEFVGGVRTDPTGGFQFYAAPGRWTLEVQVAGGSRTRAIALELGDHQLVEVEA